MRPLILTGFMGTGKTTVGRLLARRFGLEFVDTDAEVERRAGCSVAELFARDGESRFRELETQIFRAALQAPERVIATGGGTLLSNNNRLLLGTDRQVICLTCDPDTITQRVGEARERPLFTAQQPHSVRTLLAEREPVYSLYPQVDTTDRSPEQVAEAIADLYPLTEAAAFDLPQSQSSRVLFEDGVLTRAGAVLTGSGLTSPILLLTDSHVAGLPSFDAIQRSLDAAGLGVHVHTIPRGEQHKTLRTMDGVYQAHNKNCLTYRAPA